MDNNTLNAPAANAPITAKAGLNIWYYKNPDMKQTIAQVYGENLGTFDQIARMPSGALVIGIKFNTSQGIGVYDEVLKKRITYTKAWVYENQVTWPGKDDVIKPPVKGDDSKPTPPVKDPTTNSPNSGTTGGSSGSNDTGGEPDSIPTNETDKKKEDQLNIYLSLLLAIVVFFKFILPKD